MKTLTSGRCGQAHLVHHSITSVAAIPNVLVPIITSSNLSIWSNASGIPKSRGKVIF